MPSPGDVVELRPERPVVGGRMLARLGGEVVLVSGAIPGERIAARIERRQQGVLQAVTVEVLDASPDRRDPGADPACGGMTFAHVAYSRQCALKAEIVRDALARIAKLARDGDVALTPSPVVGYRARYRVHAQRGRLGFYRENTHDVCDVASSGQLAPESQACLEALAARLPEDAGATVAAFEWVENLPNSDRVVNLAMREPASPSGPLLAAVAGTPGVRGVSWTRPHAVRVSAVAGQPWVEDPVAAFLGDPVPEDSAAAVERRVEAEIAVLRRHAPAFFQANRFLAPVLARKVLALVGQAPYVDLYAGVGLFAITLAAAGHDRIVAVESDPISALDLQQNARAFRGTVQVAQTSVESYLGSVRDRRPGTLVVDPPRTGMSREAVRAILAVGALRLVYVSCDVATFARDARRLVDAGYSLDHLEALDLFPNTPHVEAVAAFERA
jgi:23S rRNA (uracil1939-C5)-methyltransferase